MYFFVLVLPVLRFSPNSIPNLIHHTPFSPSATKITRAMINLKEKFSINRTCQKESSQEEWDETGQLPLHGFVILVLIFGPKLLLSFDELLFGISHN